MVQSSDPHRRGVIGGKIDGLPTCWVFRVIWRGLFSVLHHTHSPAEIARGRPLARETLRSTKSKSLKPYKHSTTSHRRRRDLGPPHKKQLTCFTHHDGSCQGRPQKGA